MLKIQQNVHVAAYEIVTTDVPILTRKGLNIFMRLREKIGWSYKMYFILLWVKQKFNEQNNEE